MTAPLISHAQNPYTPTQKGTELKYRLENKEGSLTGYRRIKVEESKETAEGLMVTTVTTNYDANDVLKEKQPVMEYHILITEDKVVYLKEGMVPKLDLPDDTELLLEGDDVVYLTKYTPGQVFPIANITAYTHKKKESRTKVRKLATISAGGGVGGSTETITVPYGTFQAMTLTEQMEFKAAGGLVDQTQRMKKWLVPGVGQVQAEQYDKKGNVTTRVKLIAVTKHN